MSGRRNNDQPLEDARRAVGHAAVAEPATRAVAALQEAVPADSAVAGSPWGAEHGPTVYERPGPRSAAVRTRVVDAVS